MAFVPRIIFTILCLTSILAGNALGASISPLSESQEQTPRIAECRELCYRQSMPGITPPLLCRSRPECYMCHDYCRVLVVVQQSLATSMCADREFCTRGCRVACSYHRLKVFQFHQDTSANAVLKK
ncbi:uncharacterized protein LOC108117513 [Drosophila eugracilis]|uniref:uncharacterized protein LOC108117513 n=1 Tax=Drosophila eugracilis TaxID=29029 RepID=UPI0007E74F44|nr:uncharacterized protein LOC108117513 [Drosophila eugracilis]